MRESIMAGLVGVSLLLLGCGGGGNRNDQVKSAGEATEAEVIELTNRFRTEQGLPILRRNETLMTAARDHAFQMATHEDLSHTLGGNPGSRLHGFGYDWAWCGENIAWNQRSSDEVVESWKDSPGHRRNMMTTQGDEIGVGIMYSRSGEPYYCQLFGRSKP